MKRLEKTRGSVETIRNWSVSRPVGDLLTVEEQWRCEVRWCPQAISTDVYTEPRIPSSRFQKETEMDKGHSENFPCSLSLPLSFIHHGG